MNEFPNVNEAPATNPETASRWARVKEYFRESPNSLLKAAGVTLAVGVGESLASNRIEGVIAGCLGAGALLDAYVICAAPTGPAEQITIDSAQ